MATTEMTVYYSVDDDDLEDITTLEFDGCPVSVTAVVTDGDRRYTYHLEVGRFDQLEVRGQDGAWTVKPPLTDEEKIEALKRLGFPTG